MNFIGWTLIILGGVHLVNGIASLGDTFITPPIPYSLDLIHNLDYSLGLGTPMIVSAAAAMAFGYLIKRG